MQSADRADNGDGVVCSDAKNVRQFIFAGRFRLRVERSMCFGKCIERFNSPCAQFRAHAKRDQFIMDKATREKIARNANAVYKPQSIMEQLKSAYPHNASRVKIEAVRARKNRALLGQKNEAEIQTTEKFARNGDEALARNGRNHDRVMVLDRGIANNTNGFKCHSVNVDAKP